MGLESLGWQHVGRLKDFTLLADGGHNLSPAKIQRILKTCAASNCQILSIDALCLSGYISVTTRHLVRTNRGVVRTSRGVVKNSPGLVKPTPGLVDAGLPGCR